MQVRQLPHNLELVPMKANSYILKWIARIYITRRLGQNSEYKYFPLGRNCENSVGERISEIITITLRLQSGHVGVFPNHIKMHRLQKAWLQPSKMAIFYKSYRLFITTWMDCKQIGQAELIYLSFPAPNGFECRTIDAYSKERKRMAF